MTGGELVTRALAAAGIDTVFTLVGGHTTPVVDACDEVGIRLVDVRHEETAAHMAHAWARVTGRTGVALVTAGPGVTNAATGIANAWSGGAPVLLLGGGVPRPQLGRGALHEIDQLALMATITKRSETVADPAHLPELVADVIAETRRGRPGPAFLELPSDVLRADAPQPETWPLPGDPARIGADDAELDTAARLLADAERPLVVAGSGVFWAEAWDELRELVERLGAPAITSHAARGLLPFAHPHHVPAARSLALREADVVLVAGSRFNFMLAYGQPPRFNAEARVIQIDVDPSAIGRNRSVAVGLVGDARTVLSQVLERVEHGPPGPWLAQLREADERAKAALEAEAASDAVPIHPLRVCRELARALPDDAFVAADGGDILSFARQAVPVSTPGGWLDSGPFGCLGYGIASACAARLARPDRPAVALLGDGALGLQAMELDTAARHGLGILVVVSTNGSWAIEATSQEMEFGRAVATQLERRPYHVLADALGCEGIEVTRPEELPAALSRQPGDRPLLVNVVTDPAAKSPDARRGLGLVPREQAIAF
jgi:acetolactate synthase-1/2/3 large subunit